MKAASYLRSKTSLVNFHQAKKVTLCMETTLISIFSNFTCCPEDSKKTVNRQVLVPKFSLPVKSGGSVAVILKDVRIPKRFSRLSND